MNWISSMYKRLETELYEEKRGIPNNQTADKILCLKQSIAKLKELEKYMNFQNARSKW